MDMHQEIEKILKETPESTIKALNLTEPTNKLYYQLFVSKLVMNNYIEELENGYCYYKAENQCNQL